MKSIYLSLIFLLAIATEALAQFSEFGGGVGATNVRTDIGGVNMANTRYGVNAFYRMNFNHIWVARTELKYVNMASADKNYNDLLSENRKYSFYNNAIEASFSMEFNFLNFRYPKDEHKWCPFITAGLANYVLLGNSEGSISAFNLAIPFGFGVKYKLDDHWNLGFVYTASKTFNDKIDGITSNAPSNYTAKVRGNDSSTNDWYHFAGLTISYTLYKLKCPKHLEDEKVPTYWQGQFR